MMRGVRVRERFRRMKNRLRRSERGVIELQSLVRGQMIRIVFDNHLKDYRASMDWAMKVVPLKSVLTFRFKLVQGEFWRELR
jgi:hypothetical protein